MTKQEAKQVLEHEGICPFHGVEFTHPKGLQEGWHASPFCHLCRNEADARRQQKIDAAKKVLGL